MNNLLTYYITLEEQLIFSEIQKVFLSDLGEIELVSSEKILQINTNLILADESNIARKVHKNIINSLINVFLEEKFPNELEGLKIIFQSADIALIKEFNNQLIDKIPLIIEELHIAFLNSEFQISNGTLTRKKSKHTLKESGAVYTHKKIAKEIVEQTIENAIDKIDTCFDITCLDFASGTGRFYFEAVQILRENYDIPLQQVICNNLFAVDIDETAISVLQCKIVSLFQELNPEIIKALRSNILHRNVLIPKVTLITENNLRIDLSEDFKEVFRRGGFDVVFSNPPYYLLKVNKKGTDEQKSSDYLTYLRNKIQNEINFFRNSGVYHYSIEGMLNYYQLSIEMILRITKKNGQIGIICPSSLFADLTTAKLRKHILTSHKLYSLRYYPESARLFENITQSTVIAFIQKDGKTDKIGIEISQEYVEIDLKKIKSVFPENFEIPLIDQTGWEILAKISKFKKIKDISFLRNRRGELDLTLYRTFITNDDTGWRLVRGNMITDNGVSDTNREYVQIESFLKKKSDDFKLNDFGRKRLICPQISNIDMYKRIKFVFSEKNDIIGNSCNYIVSTRDQVDLEKLVYLLNSELLNWRFKITNSNNHISNYELDELPIIDLDSVGLTDFSNNKNLNEIIVCKYYGLNEEEIKYILRNKNKLTGKVSEYEQYFI